LARINVLLMDRASNVILCGRCMWRSVEEHAAPALGSRRSDTSWRSAAAFVPLFPAGV